MIIDLASEGYMEELSRDAEREMFGPWYDDEESDK